MVTALREYLATVGDNLRIDPLLRKEILSELKGHIEDELEELRERGISEEEAVKTCVRLLGSAKLVARQICEAHSQGSWRQAWLASMPHMLFGLIFTLNWWQGLSGLLVMLGLVLTLAIYGWWHGRPGWLFPWMGYSLLPVVAAGIFLLYLPREWSWVAIIIYLPLALWLVCSIAVETIRKDWLYSTLMLLPVPIVIGWFVAVGLERQYPDLSLQRLYNFAPWISFSFLTLGTSVAMFVRLRQRWLKILVLFLSGLFTMILVVYNAFGELSLLAFLLPIIIMLGLFLTPALLERKLRPNVPLP